MLELKKKYNELLSRYNKGVSMMAEVKDDKEKETEYLELLKNIQLEMNNVLMSIGEYSDEETVNGFVLEIIEDAIPVETTAVEENVSQATTPALPPVIHNQPNVINTIDNYRDNWEMATNLSKSDLVPDNYKNKPENVIIALGMSQQTGLPPFTIMQNLNIVRGKASFSGSFCRTLIEKTGKYASLDLKYIGEKGKDSYGAYLQGIRRDGSIVDGPQVTIEMAKKEGWYSKKDKYGNETSKWQTMPELMLGYRATAFFARLYEPSALNGVYTSEELDDISYGNTVREVKDVL
jgi:hypothetical protein